MAMKLYAPAGDFRGLKALVAASFNGITLEQPVFELGKDNVTPEYLSKVPTGKVPSLETDSGVIFESNAIARYIARVRRDTQLMGSSFFEQGLVDAWVDFCSLELELPATMWVYPVLGYSKFNFAVHNKATADMHKALKVLNAHLTANTFLVGSSITLADIVNVCALLYPMKFVLDANHRKAYPAVTRWFLTVVNDPRVAHVLGDVVLCEKEMIAKGNTSKAKGKGGKGAGKKEGKKGKGGAKKAAAASGGGAAAAAAKPAKKSKPKGPFDDLPKSKMNMDAFKKLYSNPEYGADGNRDYYSVMPKFWDEMYDAEGYSIWWCVYNYNDENLKDFMTSNLVGGFVQRTDQIRKYAFGSVQILDDKAPFQVRGCWMFRGDSVQPMLDCNPDAEYYTWTRVDTTKEEERKRIADYWCAYEKVDGLVITDTKLFK